MSHERRATIPGHVFARDFDGELVVLDLDGGEYFGLDAVGALIWHGLGEGLTLEAIAGRVVERYEVDAARALADVSALAEELAAKGLITLA